MDGGIILAWFTDFIDDFIDGAQELGEAFKDLGKGLYETGRDSSKEFGELMTDGVKEMIFKNNHYYQTSFEKVDNARQIISSSKSRYKKTYEELQSYYSETVKKINNHIEYKMHFCNVLLANNQNSVNQILNINLDEQIVSRSLQGIESSVINDYKKSVSSIISVGGNTAKFNSIMGMSYISGIESSWFVTQRRRVEEADAALGDAKEFRAMVDIEIEKLKITQSKLGYIRLKVEEERSLLSRFGVTLDNITSFLNSTYNRIKVAEKEYQSKNLINKILYNLKVFVGIQENKMLLTDEERKKVISNIEIAKMLNLIINTQFINEDFEISSEYEQTIITANEFENSLIERGF
jgi:hypothetical protein